MAAVRVSLGTAGWKGHAVRASGPQRENPVVRGSRATLTVIGPGGFTPFTGLSSRNRVPWLPISRTRVSTREGSPGGRDPPLTRTRASKHSAWETLGLKPNSNTAQIKKAYRKLVMLYHPDVAEEEGTDARFQEIHEAYLILQGKLDGESARGGDEKWDFHDWYWSFAARHRKRDAAGGAFTRRTEGQKSVHRAKVSQQLQQLKKRARSRSAKAAGTTRAVPPPEVHPAWAAVSSYESDGELGGSGELELIAHSMHLSGSHDESSSHAEPTHSWEQGETYHHSHRPPSIGSSHLASQLSGLRRKAKLRDQVSV